MYLLESFVYSKSKFVNFILQLFSLHFLVARTVEICLFFILMKKVPIYYIFTVLVEKVVIFAFQS